MSNNIIDIKANYIEVEQLFSFDYEEIEGEEFSKYIFPNNQDQGELSGDYSKPNVVYLYKDPKDEVEEDMYEKLTDIRIERNKRNYRNQELHLMGARLIQEINDKINYI